MGTTESNLLIAIKAVEGQQTKVKNPSLWQAYEEELIELRNRLGELKHGTTK